MVYICFYVIFYVQVGWSDSRWHGQVTGKKHSGLHETVRISDLMPRFCRSCRGDRGEEHCLSMLGVAHSPKCGRENILRECLQEFLQELHPTPATIRHWKRICPWPQNPCQETQNHHKVQELSSITGITLVTNYCYLVAPSIPSLTQEERWKLGVFFLWVAGLGIESPPLSSQVRAEAFHVGHVSCLSGRMTPAHKVW